MKTRNFKIYIPLLIALTSCVDVVENDKANNLMDQYFEFRPWLQQYLWLTDNVHVKKIEEEQGEILNKTTKMPDHNDDEYLEAGRSIIQKYYSEDLRRFGYE